MLQSMPRPSAELIGSNILSSVWYPMKDGLLEPTKAMCEIFYNGDARGAQDAGIYSAYKSLHGVYKIFIKIASPDRLMKRAEQLFSSYYDPARIELNKLSDRNYIVRFSEFDPPSPYIEHRVAGRIKKALEICGGKDIEIEVIQHASNKNEFSKLLIKWQ